MEIVSGGNKIKIHNIVHTIYVLVVIDTHSHYTFIYLFIYYCMCLCFYVYVLCVYVCVYLVFRLLPKHITINKRLSVYVRREFSTYLCLSLCMCVCWFLLEPDFLVNIDDDNNNDNTLNPIWKLEMRRSAQSQSRCAFVLLRVWNQNDAVLPPFCFHISFKQ